MKRLFSNTPKFFANVRNSGLILSLVGSLVIIANDKLKLNLPAETLEVVSGSIAGCLSAAITAQLVRSEAQKKSSSSPDVND